MKSLVSKQLIWQRELAYARDPASWLGFAREAANCARFLSRTWCASVMTQADTEAAPLDPPNGFFAPKFIRLLMGIALENAVKGLLLAGPGSNRFVKADRIVFEKKGHDLLWLFGEAQVELSEEETFYVAAWAISVEWFGKYPFPLEANRVLDEPQPLGSSDALIRRRLRGGRRYMHRDLLHAGDGRQEWAVFDTVFGRLEERHLA